MRIETNGNTITGNYFDMASGNEIEWASANIQDGNIILGNINQGNNGTFILNNFIGSNIGIGTINPGGKFTVQGGTPDAGDLFNVNNANGQLIGRIYQDGANNGVLHILDNSGTVKIQLYSSGTSYFKGNVTVQGPAWGAGNEGVVALGDSNNYIKAIYAEGVRIGVYNGTGIEDALCLKQGTSVNVGIGQTNPGSKLDVAGAVTLEATTTPSNPSQSSEGRLYVKANKLIAQFNDAGTIRYKYLNLTGTGVTWVHTTVAP